ncbi:hypothetical protein GGF46_004688 [Coemansia sp. RSA 552]|nr:hypothetical protein GGF46_004688 [Coemansia sp. RSA 552]
MNVQELTPRIREILQMSDLSTVSAKKVRRQLENELNQQLDAYKADIDEIIKLQFQQLHSETQQRQHAQQQYVQQYSQQAQQQGMGYVSPPGMGLQGPGGYPGGVGAPGMPMMVPGGAPPAENVPRKRGRPRKPENEKKQQRKKRELDPNRPKRQTGLSKPMKLSPALSEFLGQKYCARTDVVKKLWVYIKANDLQDPSDKRHILCDAKLKTVFDTDRLYMYTMNKLLNDHLIKPTPEENAEAMQLLGLPPSHPAAQDSIGVTAPTPAAKAEEPAATAAAPASTTSPTPSDGQTPATDAGANGSDGKPAKQEAAASPQPQPRSPQAQQTTSTPLVLPSMPSGVNGGNPSSGNSV